MRLPRTPSRTPFGTRGPSAASRARRTLLALAAAALAGCNDDPPAGRPDSLAARDDGGDTAGAAPVTAAGTWVQEAGPVLVVPAGAATRASIVFPEFTDSTLTDTTTFDVVRLRGARVDLLGRGGLVSASVPVDAVPELDRPEGCTGWPAARLTSADGATQPWTVAFVAGRVRPVPLDSLEGMARADSARLAADVARVVSALPDTGDSTFAGRPFLVRAAYRFPIAPGVEGVAADVMRTVNQEANPRAEHLLVVAERESGGKWGAAYVERASGHEETLEVSEVLAAAFVGNASWPTLVLARDYGDGTAYALLERDGPRRWRVRWSSAYAGC